MDTLENKLTVEIVTPEGTFYEKLAYMVVLKSIDGEIGILPKHISYVTAFLPGEIRVKLEGKWEIIEIGSGFLEVRENKVTILTGMMKVLKESVVES